MEEKQEWNAAGYTCRLTLPTGMEMALKCDHYPGRTDMKAPKGTNVKQPMYITGKMIEIDDNHSSKPKLGLA